MPVADHFAFQVFPIGYRLGQAIRIANQITIPNGVNGLFSQRDRPVPVSGLRKLPKRSSYLIKLVRETSDHLFVAGVFQDRPLGLCRHLFIRH